MDAQNTKAYCQLDIHYVTSLRLMIDDLDLWSHGHCKATNKEVVFLLVSFPLLMCMHAYGIPLHL